VTKGPNKTLIVLVVLASIALIAALATAGVLYYKHRKLYRDYSQLVSRDVPLEEDTRDRSGVVHLDKDN